MKPRVSNERGLTLVELCLTLLIIGVLAAMASPRLSGSYHSLRTRMIAERMAGQMQFALSRARLSGRAWRLRVWDDGRGYSIETMLPDHEADSFRHRRPAWKLVEREALPREFALAPAKAAIPLDMRENQDQTRLSLRRTTGETFHLDWSGPIVLAIPANDPQ